MSSTSHLGIMSSIGTFWNNSFISSYHIISHNISFKNICTKLNSLYKNEYHCFHSVSVGLAAAIPNLGAVISLVGAVSSSTLALIFPPVIEIITLWNDGLGRRNWILWKDILIIIFGVCGFGFGTYASIMNILHPLS